MTNGRPAAGRCGPFYLMKRLFRILIAPIFLPFIIVHFIFHFFVWVLEDNVQFFGKWSRNTWLFFIGKWDEINDK
jgi:hypothetical protein